MPPASIVRAIDEVERRQTEKMNGPSARSALTKQFFSVALPPRLPAGRPRELVTDHGTAFFVCNNALSGRAYAVAQAITPNLTDAAREQVVAIHDEMVEHFLPRNYTCARCGRAERFQEQRFRFLPG
jgi:hypothetical protein